MFDFLFNIFSIQYILRVNFNKFMEFKCYFVGNLVFLLVLVMKLTLITAAEIPPLISPSMVEVPPFFFPIEWGFFD